MALKADLRSLPTNEPTTTHPSLFGDIIADYLEHVRDEQEELPLAGENARIRHSWAGICARRLGYHVRGDEPSDPPDAESIWSFEMGHRAHELIQNALQWRFGDACQVEVKVTDLPGERACHIDAVLRFDKPTPFVVDGVTYPCKVVAFELKSTGGYGWSQQVKAEGPKIEAYLQGCLNAAAVDADLMVLGYVTLDRQTRTAKSVYGAEKGRMDAVYAEWCYPKVAYMPDAEHEADRMRKVLEFVDSGVLPPRSIPALPKGARVVDPSSGRWEQRTDGQITQAGSDWRCGFCPMQARCVAEVE